MKKHMLKNILMNFGLMVVYVALNNWALKEGLEETFVFLAMAYGITVVIANAIFVRSIF